ncbi:MAG: 4-amino-4-deoxy-L-arabinose transferase-like glycosyltransferase [Chitinophagales bacterium]|jgi:4-amino-4-deoxy-L-arabinose transferase-like glycosyltransferase
MFSKKSGTYLLGLVILISFLVRLTLFVQERDLFIDEANLAANIHERSYTELLSPLAYEQYAPPLFLWGVKASTQVFGFSEKALRLLPFAAGILSIFLFSYLCYLLLGKEAAIYPLALFGGGMVFLQYGTELKQYSSDFLLTLILLLAAILTRKKEKGWGYILLWIFLGSFAIWLSMPSVFILFSIGVFWVLDHKSKSTFIKSSFIASFWLAQFGLYFFLVLKNQISSDYLQDFHMHSFLKIPWSFENISHDYMLISSVIKQSGGHTFLAVLINGLLLIIGGAHLVRKDKKIASLFLTPFALLLLAGLLHKYAFVPRLLLFIQPLVLLLIAFGLACLFKVKNWPIRIAVIVLLLVNIFNHQNFKYLYEPYEIQEIHYALNVLEGKQTLKQSDPIWVHLGAVPAFHFYTKISPKKKRYSRLINQAKLLSWDTDYGQLYQQSIVGERFWLLMTNYFPEDKASVLSSFEGALLIESLDKPGCLLLHYEKQ